MKKMKKMIALLTSALLLMGCLTACGGSEGKQAEHKGKKEIEIAYWRSGMGSTWLENMAKAFEEKYPEYYVTVKESSDNTAVTSSWTMDDIDTTDLYMAITQYWTKYMEPLDDILESPAEGDTMALKDKFNSAYLNYAEADDGHYYALTYGGGLISFAYNTKMFKEAGIEQLPRTSDELAVVCDTLKTAGFTPMCHFKNGGYYTYLMSLYQVQYDGMDYYLNNFYGCVDEKGNSPSMEVFKTKDGRYYALQAMEKFITPDYTLTGSNSKTHTEIQTEFLSGRAAMMLNGSWLMSEMKNSTGQENFQSMKPPVLSAIKNKLTTVKTEPVLRALISAIDQVTDGEKQLSDFASGDGYNVGGTMVSKADWDAVYAARNSMCFNYDGEGAWVPNYSDQKEGAKKFLKFMYSDEGYKIYTAETNVPLPLSLSSGEEVDTTNWSDFEKSQLELMKTAVSFAGEYAFGKHAIFRGGGAKPLAGLNYVNYFSSQNEADRKSTEQIWESMCQIVDDKYENTWLKNIQ